MVQPRICLVWLLLYYYFLLLRDSATKSAAFSSSQLFVPMLSNIFPPAFALALLTGCKWCRNFGCSASVQQSDNLRQTLAICLSLKEFFALLFNTGNFLNCPSKRGFHLHFCLEGNSGCHENICWINGNALVVQWFSPKTGDSSAFDSWT